MTTIQIMKQLATIHNLLLTSVSGEDAGTKAIATGDAIRELRILLRQLKETVESESAEPKIADHETNANDAALPGIEKG